MTHITMTFRLTMTGFQTAWKCLWNIGAWSEVTFHDTRSLTRHRWLTPMDSYRVDFYAPILMGAVFKRRVLVDNAQNKTVYKPVTVVLTKGVHPVLSITASLEVRQTFENIIDRLLKDRIIQEDEYLGQKKALDEALAAADDNDPPAPTSHTAPVTKLRYLFGQLEALIEANRDKYDSPDYQNIIWQLNTLQTAVLTPIQSDSERSETL